jgi:lipid-A-disaccharide synthase
MKYYLIAGEASGDLHASNLMKELKKADPSAVFEFLGGDLMLAQGGTMHKHYREMAFMGILPVVLHFRTIEKNFALCKETLLRFRPDVLILVDYPGFNLRMAKFAKQIGIWTAYYISPKIWAWKTKRVYKVKAFIDRMFTIFPFETDFYKKYDYPVSYVGNPLYESITSIRKKSFDIAGFIQKNNLSDKPVVALLAGSRKHEISSLLPDMLSVVPYFSGYQFVIAGAPGIETSFYDQFIKGDVKIIFGQTYELLRVSQAALVTSGTATLETALFNVPQVVCYRLSPQWFIEKMRPFVLKTKYFSLVNLVADEEVVLELFQRQVSTSNLKNELDKILNNTEYRLNILDGYKRVASKLKAGNAPELAANQIVEWING